MGFISWGDLVLVVLLPLVAWWLAGRRRDEIGAWFVAGAMCFAVAVALNVLVFAGALAIPVALIRALLYATVFLLIEYFRRLLAAPGPRVGGVLFLGVCVAIFSMAVGLFWKPSYGALIHHLFLSAIQIYLLSWLLRARRELRSRGVLSIALAICLVLLANLSQIASIFLSGAAISLAGQSTLSVLIYLANFACVILYSLGYLALRAEIAQSAEVEMAMARTAEEERRRSAEAIIAERNRMILVNSRFEARNNLGLFNAAVIHEISQPLQKMVLNVELLARSQQGLRGDPEFAELQQDIRSVVGIVHSLRGLLVDVMPSTKIVSVTHVIDPIRPIIEAEARLRGITLRIDNTSVSDDDAIEVDPILFNRVVLNLISNAFQSEATTIDIRFRKQQGGESDLLLVACVDNGRGLPHDFDLSQEWVPTSGLNQGMGVGLLLSRQLISLWRGRLELRKRVPGVEVQLILPLIRSALG